MEWENFEDRACINYLQLNRTEESPTPYQLQPQPQLVSLNRLYVGIFYVYILQLIPGVHVIVTQSHM